jgi:hypothetical protein
MKLYRYCEVCIKKTDFVCKVEHLIIDNEQLEKEYKTDTFERQLYTCKECKHYSETVLVPLE